MWASTWTLFESEFSPKRFKGLSFQLMMGANFSLDAIEIGWPFRLGLEGCIVDRSQNFGWQRTFGHGSKIVPEMLQRGGADDDAIIAFGV